MRLENIRIYEIKMADEGKEGKSLKAADGAVELATTTKNREENVQKQQQKSLMNFL